MLCSAPCSFDAFAVLHGLCTVQHDVLELDGGSALHVHLAGKSDTVSVQIPPLRHSW